MEVTCVPALLYADDMVILANDEAALSKGLETLEEWCRLWAVKVTVSKCGIVHIRRGRIPRSDTVFKVGSEEIGMVEHYKNLSCMLNETLDMKGLVVDGAKAGDRALGAWLRRCRQNCVALKGVPIER